MADIKVIGGSILGAAFIAAILAVPTIEKELVISKLDKVNQNKEVRMAIMSLKDYDMLKTHHDTTGSYYIVMKNTEVIVDSLGDSLGIETTIDSSLCYEITTSGYDLGHRPQAVDKDCTLVVIDMNGNVPFPPEVEPYCQKYITMSDWRARADDPEEFEKVGVSIWRDKK